MYTKCLRCKRALKNPKYQEVGYGSVCLRKLGMVDITRPESQSLNIHKMKTNDPDTVLTEFKGDIVLSRDGNKKFMNVSHELVKHSPTGLEWGYAGSGPADMALNILYMFTKSKKFAEDYHQAFKFEFLANMPSHGGTISGNSIKEWILSRDGGIVISLDSAGGDIKPFISREEGAKLRGNG